MFNKKKKYVNILVNECVVCGSCIKVCLRSVILVLCGISVKINRDLCVGCGICEKICLVFVIEIIIILKEEEGKCYE